jgi:hypothetical protein
MIGNYQLKLYFCSNFKNKMETTKILEILGYALPSLITGSVAYYFFDLHTKNEEGRRRYLLQKEAQKDALPLRLQAYERLSLYMERINPTNLLIRIKPISENKFDYENVVIAQIEQEFDHNLTQQIYISDECWTIIMTAKNATIQMIRKANMSEKVDCADKLRQVILNDLMEKQSPSNAALAFIKNEVGQLW